MLRDMIDVITVINQVGEAVELPDDEIESYCKIAFEKTGDRKIQELKLTIVDDDYIDIEIIQPDIPFQRIRRITGYLVGTIDRFNNAKRAEVLDRVKHGLMDPVQRDMEDVYVDNQT